MFAVIVSDAVKAIGRPSGINAIATETQSTMSVGTLMNPGCFGRKYVALIVLDQLKNEQIWQCAYQTIITTIIIVNIIEQIIITKLRISLSKGVKPIFGALVILAIFPNTVESPVDTTTPIPLPDIQ
jgi:hypothetical protein